jgi:gamma-glutamyl:cysteine ligase YbdK (ATP-grasp superfamily)
MGLEIPHEQFRAEDYARFRDRLGKCLVVLERLLERPDFGVHAPSLGAELEVTLIDRGGRPLPLNEVVLKDTLDDRMTVELDRFNLECNLRHTGLRGRPFETLRGEIETARAELHRAASLHGGRVVTVGILPTLLESDLGSDAMTESVRYRALSRSLRERRREPFHLRISGVDQLDVLCGDVTFEGAATSFQIHLAVPTVDFASVFNAAQLATAPVLAAAGNSPTFLGHRLWEETRVALFKQAVDERDALDRHTHRPARVSLGSGWVRDGAIELFRASARDYSVLLPVVYDEDPEEAVEAGRTPELKEIRLHQGTVWHWNRPVYDAVDGGHVRIELRALPSGPTTADMLANAAFLVGVSLGLAPHMDEVRTGFEFDAAQRNLYRAARLGLEAPLEWPAGLCGTGGETSARVLLPKLAPFAREGLRGAGVTDDDSGGLIDCVLERVDRGQTGAAWQRARLADLAPDRPDMEALTRMLEDYVERSDTGEPVHTWDLP